MQVSTDGEKRKPKCMQSALLPVPKEKETKEKDERKERTKE